MPTSDTSEKLVTGNYSPLSSSPIHSEKLYTIEVRRPTREEAPEDYLGPIIYSDDVVGKLVAWLTPGANQSDISKFEFAINNYKNYSNLKSEYQEIIKSSPFVCWTLVPFLLGVEIRGLNPLPSYIRSDVRLKKDFFHFLVQEGAKYKHSLAGAYGFPTLETFKLLLEIYGVEASVPQDGTLNLIQLSLTSHYDHYAWSKIEELLNAGADINARIDEEYLNTILHYLIALEHSVPIVIQLIDFIENKRPNSNKSEKQTWNLDYNLQDRFGKTPLLLAVGLNAAKVVEKLLEDVLKKKKEDIGLNTPDSKGRTPCMIAAALGHFDILKKLIQAGANCYLKDKQGRDLLWYANASREKVSGILKSYSIHPDREASQLHSYLYSSTNEAYPVALVEKNSGQKQLLVLSKQEPHYSLLKIVLKAAANKNDPELNYHYLKQQFDSMHTELSILDSKITNQQKTRNYIKEVLFRLACAFGDLDTVKRIGEEKDFDLTSCDHLKRTAMHYTVMTKKLVKNLIESTGYPDTAENCLKNHAKVFEYLIDKTSTFLECKNVNGNTPLFLIQRDVDSDDADTREQALTMLEILKENNLLPNEQYIKI